MTNTDYIVCTGYAELIYHLVSRYQGKGLYAGVGHVLTKKFEDHSAHTVNLINLIDEKYDINGYYYLDSCWDSQKKNQSKSLAYFLLPVDDAKNIKGNSDSHININTNNIMLTKTVQSILRQKYNIKKLQSKEFSIFDELKFNKNLYGSCNGVLRDYQIFKNYKLLQQNIRVLKERNSLINSAIVEIKKQNERGNINESSFYITLQKQKSNNFVELERYKIENLYYEQVLSNTLDNMTNPASISFLLPKKQNQFELLSNVSDPIHYNKIFKFLYYVMKSTGKQDAEIGDEMGKIVESTANVLLYLFNTKKYTNYMTEFALQCEKGGIKSFQEYIK